MNLELLHQRIRQPDTILETEIASFKDLCKKYPASQFLSLLYLKALVQHKQLNFEEELTQHAFRITDREKLHELLFHAVQAEGLEDHLSSVLELDEEEQALPSEAKQVEPVQLIEKNEVDEIIEPTLEAETTEETEKITAASLEIKEEGEEIKVEIEEIQLPNVETEPKKEAHNEELPNKEHELEREILSHVAAAAYSLELSEEKSEPKTKEPKTQPHPVSEREQTKSFTSWLKTGKTDPETIESPATTFQQKQVQTTREEKTKEKTEFYSASKKAKESVSEHGLVYSETLANIFALQGNYPKAILAFEQLMLTNPEKKRYFAKKIRDLKLKLDT